MFMRVKQPNLSYQDPTAFVDHISRRSKNLCMCVCFLQFMLKRLLARKKRKHFQSISNRPK